MKYEKQHQPKKNNKAKIIGVAALALAGGAIVGNRIHQEDVSNTNNAEAKITYTGPNPTLWNAAALIAKDTNNQNPGAIAKYINEQESNLRGSNPYLGEQTTIGVYTNQKNVETFKNLGATVAIIPDRQHQNSK